MGNPEVYGPDAAFAPAEVLEQCVHEFGTPVLIYDAGTLRERCRQLENAFAWNQGFRQYFPLHAVDEPGVLRILGEEGSGVACANALELQLAGMAGISGERILFLSAFPKPEDVKTAARLGCTPVINSFEQLVMYRELGWRPKEVGLRFQPGQRFALRGHLAVLSNPSKFGMSAREILEAAKALRDWGVETLGLSIQLSANENVSGYLAAMAKALLEVAPEIEAASGARLAWCNIGGGLAVPDRKKDCLDLNLEAELVRLELEQAGRSGLPVHTMLGRYVAAPAGILLSSVLGIRRDQRNFLGVDASMADLPRQTMTGVSHHISLLGNSRIQNRKTYYVEGNTMEKMDHHGKRHILPEVKAGDILVFHDAGAYTRSMASNYGGSLRCPVVLLDGGKRILLRRRETENDYFALFSEQEQQK